MGAAPQKPARESAPSAPSAGGVEVLDKMLLLDERPPATAGSRAQNSAPEGWDAERTAEDAPCGKRQWELRRRNLRANQLPQHQVLGGVG